MKNKRFEDVNCVSDIVDVMIRGLKREWVSIDMYTYGYVNNKDVCFGCAATNALCELMQTPFIVKNIKNAAARTEQFNFNISKKSLSNFEYAVNSLRIGDLYMFIMYLNNIRDELGWTVSMQEKKIIISYIRKGNWFLKARELPVLYTENYKKRLIYYEKFRDWLRKKGL